MSESPPWVADDEDGDEFMDWPLRQQYAQDLYDAIDRVGERYYEEHGVKIPQLLTTGVLETYKQWFVWVSLRAASERDDDGD